MQKIKTSYGFGLVEVLVASIIIAIGLLGAASLQSAALKNMKNNSKDMMVDLLINEMAQYIIANPREAEKGSASMYHMWNGNDLSNAHTTDSCFNAIGCETWNIAANDMAVWNTRIKEILGPTAYGIIGFDSTVSWLGPPYGNTSMNTNFGMFDVQQFDQTIPPAQYPTRITYTIKIQYQDPQGNIKIKIGQANTTFNPWASIQDRPAVTTLYDPNSSAAKDCSWINIVAQRIRGNNMFLKGHPYVTAPISSTAVCDPDALGVETAAFSVNAYDPGHLTKEERDGICQKACTDLAGLNSWINRAGLCACDRTNPSVGSKAMN